jgi:thioredoxin reductase
MHGYLTRDGVPPLAFLRLAREELAPYDTVTVRDVTVTAAHCENNRFLTTLETGDVLESRKLLLATGVRDQVPAISGISNLYGRSVFHCPYCDGWELRGQPLAVYGKGEKGYGLSLELTAWSSDILLCTDGPSELHEPQIQRLSRNGIRVREEAVLRLEGTDGVLERIIFDGAPPANRRALFFTTGQYQQSALAIQLGCELNEKGTIHTGKHEATHLPGLYVAGDASRAVQWVVVAASEGAEAAFAINTDLITENLK